MADLGEKTFGELLVEAAEEMLAVHRGEKQPARVDYLPIIRRQRDVEPPPHHDAERITRVRTSMGVSRAIFATLLNVSPSTARAWEREHREPGRSTKRLLEVAEKYSGILLLALNHPQEAAEATKKESPPRAK